MKIIFINNQDNNAYRLCKWLRSFKIDVHLYIFSFPFNQDPRSFPELIDRKIKNNYPDWISSFKRKKNGDFLGQKDIKKIEKEYDLVVTTGLSGLVYASQFSKIPVIHWSLGGEVSIAPLKEWPDKNESRLCLEGLKKVQKIKSDYTPSSRTLVKLGLWDKVSMVGYPEDIEGNRNRVDKKLLKNLNKKYKKCDLVFLWLSRLNFSDPNFHSYKGADKFLDAFEKVIKDKKHKVKAIIGNHGYDVQAFKKLVEEKKLQSHIDYVPHLKFWELLTYLSINNAVVFDEIDADKGELSGMAREAMSVGAIMAKSLDESLTAVSYGPDCPVININNVSTTYQTMNRLLKMNLSEKKKLKKESYEWSKKYLDYQSVIPRITSLFREVIYIWNFKENH